MGKNAPKRNRTKEEILADRIFITPLYVSGVGCTEIVNKLAELRPYSVSTVMVYADIRAVVTEWHKQRVNLIDKYKTIELAKIDSLERTYHDRFMASVAAAEEGKKIVKKSGKVSTNAEGVAQVLRPDKITTETHTAIAVGDIKWLEGVERCIRMRCELLGLNKKSAQSINHNGDDVEEDKAPVIVKRTTIFTIKPRRISNEHITEAEIINDKNELQ